MKKIVKIWFALVLSFTCVLGNVNGVKAAEAGTTKSNAIVMKEYQTYTKGWTSSNDTKKCYNKITVSNRGVLCFKIDNKTDSRGNELEFDLILYDENSNIVWRTDTENLDENVYEYTYWFDIGLTKGIYYLNIKPKFTVNYGTININYYYGFIESDSYEIENNNSKSKATKLKMNDVISGYIGDEDYSSGNNDYFKVKMEKGHIYEFQIRGYYTLEKDNVLVTLINPKNEKFSDLNWLQWEDYNYAYMYFQALYDGYYYLRLSGTNTSGINWYDIWVYDCGYYLENTKISLSNTSYTYTGEAIKPKVTVKHGSKTLKKDKDYTVSYKNNTKVGTATVTITGKGDYVGTVTKTFKINPKKTTINSLTAGSKKFTVKWSKKTVQTSGYQIRYSTSSSMSNAKTKTITKNTTTSATISGLSAKKNYYVQVRTYKNFNGKKYYSGWSDVKKIKTK